MLLISLPWPILFLILKMSAMVLAKLLTRIWMFFVRNAEMLIRQFDMDATGEGWDMPGIRLKDEGIWVGEGGIKAGKKGNRPRTCGVL